MNLRVSTTITLVLVGLLVAPPIATAECDIGATPNILFLTSFGQVILDSGDMQFFADPTDRCVIVSEQAVFGYTLDGYPLAPGPPFTPAFYAHWFMYDQGDPVPYFPYFTGGSIVVSAVDPLDGTVGIETGFVELTIFEYF